jgi:alpha-L-fucosidase
MGTTLPPHLSEHAALWEENPRAASIEWFSRARFGLFMHYGVYSILGRGEWVMLAERIPVAEYEKLKDGFTAERFDADSIADLAVAAGMKYVNITTRHHDSFCLFRTGQTDFSSVNSPAGRDLVGELAEACRKRGLGLFLYYSYALDWRHPYFYPREAGWENARPAYDAPGPAYAWRSDADFRRYIDFVHAQLRELLTQYGPVAGLWFDPIMGYYHRADLFPVEETYALVRSLQPGCLISFKQGANGDEDFAAPERSAASLAERLEGTPAEVATAAWEKNKTKLKERCNTLQPHKWGYVSAEDGAHLGVDEVMRMLEEAGAEGSNLLLNTGPLPDGSITPEDEATLREVGRRRGVG